MQKSKSRVLAKSGPTIVLAAGGTGGHVFPAQALAEFALKRGCAPILICDQRSKPFLKSQPKGLETIEVFAPKARLMSVTWIMRTIKAVISVYKVLRARKVTAVVGFGGYPSLPAMLAGLMLGIPCYIHEQNAVLGRTNRLLIPFVRKVFLSWPFTRKVSGIFQTKTRVVGSLVRASVRKKAMERSAQKTTKQFVILVTGGSQGARIMSEVVPHAIAALPIALQKKLVIYQQVRPEHLEEVRSIYASTKAKVTMADFFDDMGKLMAAADLVICRAGASSVAEVALAGKPSILVPLKIATDNHQLYNAQHLSSIGAAVVLEEKDFKVSHLASTMERLLTSAQLLEQMSKASAASHLQKDGAEEILKDIGGANADISSS